jgi:AcrR family transcriptional regulator
MAAPRRPYAQRLPLKARRAQVLDVALRIIAEQGFAAVSMESIAREAGVTRPVVYSAFGNLQVLLAALLRREQQRALRQLNAVVPADPRGREPDDVLVGGLADFLAIVRRSPLTWRLILLPVEGAPAILQRQVERQRALLGRRIAALVRWGLEARGGPLGLDDELLAQLILSAGEEFGRLVLTDPEHFPPERLTGFARDMLDATRPTAPQAAP